MRLDFGTPTAASDFLGIHDKAGAMQVLKVGQRVGASGLNSAAATLCSLLVWQQGPAEVESNCGAGSSATFKVTGLLGLSPALNRRRFSTCAADGLNSTSESSLWVDMQESRFVTFELDLAGETKIDKEKTG